MDTFDDGWKQPRKRRLGGADPQFAGSRIG